MLDSIFKLSQKPPVINLLHSVDKNKKDEYIYFFYPAILLELSWGKAVLELQGF